MDQLEHGKFGPRRRSEVCQYERLAAMMLQSFLVRLIES